MKIIKVHGWDLSLNHSGFVELTNGELTNFWYITSIAGSANRSKKHGYRLVLSKTKDKQALSMERITWIKKFIKKVILKSKPDYIGIEDYALMAERNAHYLGEVGGIAKSLIWNKNIPFRLHDPLSVKMFVTHDGTCNKDAMEEAVLKRWDVNFSKYNPPKIKPTKKNKRPKQNRTTSEDLCDAYAIAKLVWTEYQLRNGLIKMKKLHEKEIQVFNRITKTYPVSLLDREWIRKK